MDTAFVLKTITSYTITVTGPTHFTNTKDTTPFCSKCNWLLLPAVSKQPKLSINKTKRLKKHVFFYANFMRTKRCRQKMRTWDAAVHRSPSVSDGWARRLMWPIGWPHNKMEQLRFARFLLRTECKFHENNSPAYDVHYNAKNCTAITFLSTSPCKILEMGIISILCWF